VTRPEDDTDLDVAAAAEAAEDGDGFVLDLDGFDGPLHVLLHLARLQKVDLARLSLTHLCDQYLAFIEIAKLKRIELAADYLVMAAWLSLLKSRALLPKPPADPNALSEADLASRLALKLMRLAEAREAAKRLDALDQVGRDVFLVGQPQSLKIERTKVWQADLMELLRAYGGQRLKKLKTRAYAARQRKAYPLETARKRLEAALNDLAEWAELESLSPRPERGPDAPPAPSYLASTFGAALELVRDHRLDVRQAGPFAPLFFRAHREEGGA
jgi:segregation and condensation protein A